MFINIGFGNIVNSDKIVAMVLPDSAPSKRLVQRAKEEKRIIDATQGRRTRCIIVGENESVILSSLLPETIAGRLTSKADESAEQEAGE